MTNFDLIDEQGACKLIGGENTPIHRSTLWRLVREGKYPKPIKVGPSIARWLVSEIKDVMEAQAAARNTNTPKRSVIAAANANRKLAEKPAAKRRGR